MRSLTTWAVLGAAGLACLGTLAIAKTAPTTPARSEGRRPVTTTLHDFKVRTNDGRDLALSSFRGKTLLVVNTASRCGFTPQYESLEALYEKYRERGFEVLAFPANNFMNQEPGSDAEIAQFCSLRYKTSFPLFSKVSVRGRDMVPLYEWLTKRSGFPGDIEWNFTKFLVGPDGRVVARFNSRTDPLSKDVVESIETVLAAKP